MAGDLREDADVDLCTIPEAASLAGMSPREIRILVEDGSLSSIEVGGRRRIPRAQVERIKRSRSQGTDGSAAVRIASSPAPSEPPRSLDSLESEVAELRRHVGELARRLERIESAGGPDGPDLSGGGPGRSSMRPALTPLFKRDDLEPSA